MEVDFTYSGKEAELSGLLKSLVQADVPLTFFGEDRGSIQDTYLTLMDREGA